MTKCPVCLKDGYEAVLPALSPETRQLVRDGVYSLYEMKSPNFGAKYILYTSEKTFWLDEEGHTKGWNTGRIDAEITKAVRP